MFPKNSCIGFNVESVTPVKGLTLTVWDLGGQEKIRQLWKYYVDGVDAVIFMVDSNDRDRLEEARTELVRMLDFESLRFVEGGLNFMIDLEENFVKNDDKICV